MPLVTTKEMFERSMKEHFAIGAFNINNMEFIQAITDAAEEAKSPVILQVSSSAIKYARMNYLIKMVEAAVESTTIPIALHLDHGPDFETCKKCIDAGFTSVMIDGSKYDFEENVALTKQVVEYAHSKGVVVEAELGKLAGVEDEVNVAADDARYTDPDQAYEFVQRTGCDSLAIAIGTSHGAYKFKGEAKLRFDILAKIKELIPNNAEVFTLEVNGESMINAGIYDSDIVIVKRQKDAHNGEIVVAMTEDNEVTLKTFYKEDGHIRLQPENDYMEPIILDSVTILGKAIGLYRKF